MFFFRKLLNDVAPKKKKARLHKQTKVQKRKYEIIEMGF